MENPRKRHLEEGCGAGDSCDDSSPMEVEQKKVSIDAEPTDAEPDKEHIAVADFPILTQMISKPPTVKMMKEEQPTTAPTAKKPTTTPINYVMVFNAFRQFLNAYIQAGGDGNLANTLANYAAALPIPPNPTKPLNTSAPSPLPTSIKTNSECGVEQTEPDSEKVIKQEEDDDNGENAPEPKPDIKTIITRIPLLTLPPPPLPRGYPGNGEAVTEIQRLREAAFGRYKNVLCVICNEWICSRNRKNHIEAHLNYRPYKCSGCDYARRREIFVVQHIKTHHKADEGVEMKSDVDLNVALEVDRLADECVERTRKLIESMQEKKDDDFGEGKGFDEKALELMLAEEAEKKVIVIESVSEVRAKVANYHRRQRTKVLKKIYDTDVAKGAELKIVKEEGSTPILPSIDVEDGFEIKLTDLMQMCTSSSTPSTPSTPSAGEEEHETSSEKAPEASEVQQ